MTTFKNAFQYERLDTPDELPPHVTPRADSPRPIIGYVISGTDPWDRNARRPWWHRLLRALFPGFKR